MQVVLHGTENLRRWCDGGADTGNLSITRGLCSGLQVAARHSDRYRCLLACKVFFRMCCLGIESDMLCAYNANPQDISATGTQVPEVHLCV